MTVNKIVSATPSKVGSDLKRVDAYVNTRADYDEVPELTEEFFDRAELREGDKVIRKGGRPKSPNPKQAVNIRLSAQVLDYYRDQGPGWQTRLNADLESFVAGKLAE